MNPYKYIYEATANGESLLSLCCGIGLELEGLKTQDVTAVDIAPQYLEQVASRCPQAKIVESSALDYVKEQPDNSVDIISIIDGIEHMTKRAGLKLIKEMKRVARKQILLFTPDGYLKNEPHNAWGIEGADEHQVHKSGWSALELKDLGFEIIETFNNVSQHDEKFTELMARFVCTRS
jgi:ubiquinone/menaquinone biosynthesis C-methylase UbiE